MENKNIKSFGEFNENFNSKTSSSITDVRDSEPINENVKGGENTSSDHSLICPHCGFEQDENPENILMDDSNYADWSGGVSEFGSYTCEECNEPFEFVKQVVITYITRK